MSGEFDEMVRDSMTWFTAGVDVPDGLAARARRHLRRRHRTRVGWFATGTAVAAAAAVLAASAGAGSVPHHQEAKDGAAEGGAAKGGAAKGNAAKGNAAKGARQNVTVQTTAMVISRVDRALTSAAATDPVAYTRETTQGVRLFLAVPHRRPTEVNASVTETWSRGPLEHVEVVTRTGRLALSMETDLRSGKSVQTTVSYPQRVWWRGTYRAPGRTSPGLACTLGDIDRTPGQWTREVRKLLSCGAAVAGYEKVDGVNAIKLKLSSSYQRACAGAND